MNKRTVINQTGSPTERVLCRCLQKVVGLVEQVKREQAAAERSFIHYNSSYEITPNAHPDI